MGADRCAYALWVTVLLISEIFALVTEDQRELRKIKHGLGWFLIHTFLSAFVTVSLFQSEHLSRCPMLNRMVWPRMQRWKARAAARCPCLSTPRRLGVVSSYLGLISFDRMTEPLQDDVGWL